MTELIYGTSVIVFPYGIQVDVPVKVVTCCVAVLATEFAALADNFRFGAVAVADKVLDLILRPVADDVGRAVDVISVNQ